ncbi:flagellin [Gammaproteobacteria bacterium]|mgnify:FL=1|jgi:flagellin|nr:flagellin [Gammaproteobacteria bacterium]
MTVINTNTSSMIARDAIQRNDRAMSSAMERLSTGSRINSAKDDAAGLAISDRMAAQVSGLNMAVRNANDAISMLQTAEGATKEITNMLGRMRELSVQAASGTYTDTDRTALNLEFQALLSEIERIADNTEWNGEKILAGTSATVDTAAAETALSKNIQLGASSGQTMTLSLNSWQPTVQVDSSMSAASGTARTGVDDRTSEVSTVTFVDMADGETLSIGGITITAGGAITAEELATYFEQYSAAADYGTAKSITEAAGTSTITGTWSGFTVADGGSATTVAITNGGRSDLNPLTVTGTASGTGADVKITATGVAGVDNAGAFGQGVLYYGAGVTAISISSVGGASQAVSELDLAINGAAAERAKYGAYMSRLQHASDNLANIATNTSASLSQIADADYAVETTELARTQIISQASTAMLAQANQVKQTVLALLQ